MTNWLDPKDVEAWLAEPTRENGESFTPSERWLAKYDALIPFVRALAAEKVCPWNCNCFQCMTVCVARLLVKAMDGGGE